MRFQQTWKKQLACILNLLKHSSQDVRQLHWNKVFDVKFCFCWFEPNRMLNSITRLNRSYATVVTTFFTFSDFQREAPIHRSRLYPDKPQQAVGHHLRHDLALTFRPQLEVKLADQIQAHAQLNKTEFKGWVLNTSWEKLYSVLTINLEWKKPSSNANWQVENRICVL